MLRKLLIINALIAAFIIFQPAEAKAQGKGKAVREVVEKVVDWVGRGFIAKEVYDSVKETKEPPAKETKEPPARPEREPPSRREPDRDCTGRGGRWDQ